MATTEISAAPFDLEKLIRQVYDGIYCAGKVFDPKDFSEYKNRVTWCYKIGHGGIVFVRDKYIPSLWWIDVYSPGVIPSFRTGRILCLICGAMGATRIASSAQNEVSREYFARLGFEEIEKDLFALKVENWKSALPHLLS